MLCENNLQISIQPKIDTHSKNSQVYCTQLNHQHISSTCQCQYIWEISLYYKFMADMQTATFI